MMKRIYIIILFVLCGCGIARGQNVNFGDAALRKFYNTRMELPYMAEEALAWAEIHLSTNPKGLEASLKKSFESQGCTWAKFEGLDHDDWTGDEDPEDSYTDVDLLFSLQKNWTPYDRSITVIGLSNNCVIVQKGFDPVIPLRSPGLRYIHEGDQTVVTLSNSIPGLVYTLYKGGVSTGRTITGIGDDITFDGITQEGVYTVRQGTLLMSGSVQVAYHLDHGYQRTPGSNYIATKTYIKADNTSFITDIEYYDGLGFPQQALQVAASPQGNNIIMPIYYDDRRVADVRQYNPYMLEGDTGERDDSWQLNQRAYMHRMYGDQESLYGYTENILENSPLARMRHVFAPGAVYREAGGRPATMANHTDRYEVRIMRVEADQLIIKDQFYEQDKLVVEEIVDQDGNRTTAFSDLEGKLILERRYMGSECNETQYVYDYTGMLRIVCPPAFMASYTPGNDNARLIEHYCFRYDYDLYGRMIRKWIPGAEPQYLVYDAGDRIVLSQDGNLRTAGRWLHYKYDALSRPVSTSLVELSATHEQLVSQWTAATPPAMPEGIEIEVFKYDDPAHIPGKLAYKSTRYHKVEDINSDPKGQPVYEKRAIVDDEFPDNLKFVETAYYYHPHGPLLQRVEKNHLGFVDRWSADYDFHWNMVGETETLQYRTDRKVDRTGTYTYDIRNRLTNEQIILNRHGSLMEYTYDETGQLESIRYGLPNNTEKRRYNIQGQEVSREGCNFTSRLSYHDPEQGTPSYTGNISQWQFENGDGTESYTFHYDALSRLTDSELRSQTLPDGAYSERDIEYDPNGNILAMTRTDADGDPVRMLFTYDGNRLSAVEAGGMTFRYEYDANGNMIFDGLQRLKFHYNYLNLFSHVENASTGEVVVRYWWLTDGRKLRVRSGDGAEGYDYSGSLVYKLENGEIIPESCPFSGGRFVALSYSQTRGTLQGLFDDPEPNLPFPEDCACTVYCPDNCPCFCHETEDGGSEDDGSEDANDNGGEDDDDDSGNDEDDDDDQSGSGEQPGDGQGGDDGQANDDADNPVAVTLFESQYFATDHLGSVRVRTDWSGATIHGRQNYYPFGDEWTPALPGDQTARFAFNGKERQTLGDLQDLDYGARMKPVGIPRWRTIDPLADLDVWLSPYVYMNNNPVRNIDPNGEHWYSIEEEDEDGNVVTKYYYETRQLTKQQMEDKGYTAYMGRNMELDGVYYSITGEKYDMNRDVTRDIMKAENFIIFFEEMTPEQQKAMKDIIRSSLNNFGDMTNLYQRIEGNNTLSKIGATLSIAIAAYDAVKLGFKISNKNTNIFDYLDVAGSVASISIWGSIANQYYNYSKQAAKSINNFNNHFTPVNTLKLFSDHFLF